MTFSNDLISLAKQVHLSDLAHGMFFPDENLSNEDFLISLLRQEVDSRNKRAEAERIKQAGLPDDKCFDSFDTTFQKGIRIRFGCYYF